MKYAVFGSQSYGMWHFVVWYGSAFLKMEVAGSSVSVYQTEWCHIPEDHELIFTAVRT
jgi:hypothetical protein